MSFSTTTLVLVARQILIYGGLLMIPIGMFGSFMVIIIFSQRQFNQNPCSIYIIMNGILSFFFLPLYFLPNIVTFGFQINWLGLNTPFCKFQMSYGAFTVTSIFVINCLISFDRYAMSSRSVRIRGFSSKKISRYLIIIALLLVWCLIGIPVAVLFENVPIDRNGTSICTSKSNTFLMVAAFFYYPILEGVLPIILAIYFWYLTRKHVQSLHSEEFRRRFDKQITRMYLFQIIADAIASFPFAAVNLYRALTAQVVQSQNQANIVQFVRVMAILLFYVQYCSDFYIYIVVSSDIRSKTVKILCFWHRRWPIRVNPIQIHPAIILKKNKDNICKKIAEKK